MPQLRETTVKELDEAENVDQIWRLTLKIKHLSLQSTTAATRCHCHPTVSFTAPANPLGGQQPLSMSMALQTKSKD